MSFIPHTNSEVDLMLSTIGESSIDALFDEIPESIRIHDLPGIPEALNEMALTRLIRQRAEQDHAGLNFIGAGAYQHHIPSAILDLISRGEFLTAYTPYQAEASQGTLQVIYEYQTMMASLTGMDVSNASLYEGASALAEAVLMAVRANRHSNSKHILMPENVHPFYRATVQSIVEPQHIQLISVPFCPKTGKIDPKSLDAYEAEDITALVIAQPNFFGVLEDVDALTNWAAQRRIFTIALVNPTSLALLKEPGCWGTSGVDVVCGEGQPLGVPLSSGGPYFGFLTSKKAHLRQMPGRIVGRTTDLEGNPGFALTLQAREQHIRRSKATSNICTNQGLLVTAATIYMSLLGPEGLRRVAAASHQACTQLKKQLTQLPNVEIAFDAPVFHECLIRLPTPVPPVLKALSALGIQGGFDVTPYYPSLGHCLLVCTTETKTQEDLQAYVCAIEQTLKAT